MLRARWRRCWPRSAGLRPDIVLLTGDLAANGLPEEYRRLRQVLAGFGTPMLAVPGNHDERAAFAASSPASGVGVGAGPGLWQAVEEGPVRLLGLDTLAPDGADAGVLGERQLAWIADRLGRDDKRPVLIFMHHPPFSLGLPLDWTRCADGDDLAQLVQAHPRVVRGDLRARASRGAPSLGRDHRRGLPAGRLGDPARPGARGGAVPGAAEPGLPAPRRRPRARPRQP